MLPQTIKEHQQAYPKIRIQVLIITTIPINVLYKYNKKLQTTTNNKTTKTKKQNNNISKTVIVTFFDQVCESKFVIEYRIIVMIVVVVPDLKMVFDDL